MLTSPKTCLHLCLETKPGQFDLEASWEGEKVRADALLVLCLGSDPTITWLIQTPAGVKVGPGTHVQVLRTRDFIRQISLPRVL